MFSIERLEGISTRGGEEMEKSVIEGALEDGTLGYIMSIKASRVRSLGAPKSSRTLACEAFAGEEIAPGGVDNVSTVDVEGDGPPFGVRPKAGGGGTLGDDVRLSSMGESWVRYKEPTTDSV